MQTVGNLNVAAPPVATPEDVTLGELLDALADRKAAVLDFSYDGRTMKPGYHITEVKVGAFSGIDCEANPESWTEIFVQLWDVDDSPSQMTAGKFVAIIEKVSSRLRLNQSVRLTFEVSDGVAPMQLHRAAYPEFVGGGASIALSPRPASCKPRDRWLEQNTAAACCGPSPAGKPCCGG